MKKISLHNITVCLIVFFISTGIKAQHRFKYQAALDTIQATEFYKIDLPPRVIAKCKEGLGDIRILDENGTQVPYIIKDDLPVFKKEDLTEFPIVQHAKEKDKLTHIILQNITGKPVSEMLLFIKNMDAYRTFSISGSEDSMHWFIIKENMQLANAFNNDGENIIKTLSFPRSNYRFFQLTISGENVLPFNLIKAGIYNENIVYGKYEEVRQPILTQNDSSDRRTYVALRFTDAYQINKIIIEAEGPKYFKRKIYLSDGNNNYDDLSDGYITSDAANNFALNSKTAQLNITINNEDNNPLKIISVKAFQLNVSLLTYLQAGKKYYLNFGDSLVQVPTYDLEFFSDSVEKRPLEIDLGQIEINKIIIPANQSSWLSNNKTVLWIIIIAALLMLSFFTLKILKEAHNKRLSDE
jgi:hypothetical protein